MAQQTVLPVHRGAGEAAAMAAGNTAAGAVGGALKGYVVSAVVGAVALGGAAAFFAAGGWAIGLAAAAGAAISAATIGNISAAVGAVGGGIKGFSNTRTQVAQEHAAANVLQTQQAVAQAQEQTAGALQTQAAQEMLMAGPSRMIAANGAQYQGPMMAQGQVLGAGHQGNVAAMRQHAAAQQAQIG